MDYNNQEIEWMSSTNNNSASSAATTTTTTTKIEVIGGEEDDERNKSSIEREHMFDKVVTPSDVGKLNRLVIPKQYAEKYFPLDSSNNEKGLLLNFEDRTGKPWRFRYSYWNSSQSYVMTKGWSRFVKEKKLDAGDIVSFQRGVGEVAKHKLFIDWRRRPDAINHHHPHTGSLYYHNHHHHHRTIPSAGCSNNNSPTFVLRSHPYSQPYPYPPQGGVVGWDHQGTIPTPTHLSSMNVLPPSQSHPLRRGIGFGSGYTMSGTTPIIGGGGGGSGSGTGHYGFGYPYPVTGSLIFVRSSSSSNSSVIPSLVPQNNNAVDDHQYESGGSVMQVQREEGGVEGMVYESVPVVQGKVAAKRLRLFGVNMDCPISHQTHDFDILSSSLASSSFTPNCPASSHHHHLYHPQHTTTTTTTPPIISMAPSSLSSSSSTHQHPLQLRSFFNGASPPVPSQKGKSSTSSPSMSLDFDI